MLKKKEPALTSDTEEVAGKHGTIAAEWGYIVPMPGVRYYRFLDRKSAKRTSLPVEKLNSDPEK